MYESWASNNSGLHHIYSAIVHVWFWLSSLPWCEVKISMFYFKVMCFYSKNAWLCAKWQWNARDCVTGLHGSPGIQSSNTSRVRFTVISHTPGCSRFYHIYIVPTRNWDGACLFAIGSIALLNLGETYHLKGRDMVWYVVCVIVATLVWLHYDITRFEHVLWCNTVHEWVMNIHYQTSIAQGLFIYISRTPSKRWSMSDKEWDLNLL